MNKPGIITYIDDFKRMRECGATADQIGRLQFALIEYAETGETPDMDPDICLAFALLANKYDRDQEAYEKKAAAGAKGGQKSAENRENQADASTAKQTQADASKAKQNRQTGTGTGKGTRTGNRDNKRNGSGERPAPARGIGFRTSEPAAARAGNRDAPGLGYLQRDDDMSDVLADL